MLVPGQATDRRLEIALGVDEEIAVYDDHLVLVQAFDHLRVAITMRAHADLARLEGTGATVDNHDSPGAGRISVGEDAGPKSLSNVAR